MVGAEVGAGQRRGPLDRRQRATSGTTPGVAFPETRHSSARRSGRARVRTLAKRVRAAMAPRHGAARRARCRCSPAASVCLASDGAQSSVPTRQESGLFEQFRASISVTCGDRNVHLTPVNDIRLPDVHHRDNSTHRAVVAGGGLNDGDENMARGRERRVARASTWYSESGWRRRFSTSGRRTDLSHDLRHRAVDPAGIMHQELAMHGRRMGGGMAAGRDDL